MSLSKFDNMWQLISKYKFDYDNKSANEHLKCVICNNILANPVLNAVCGCQYCYECLNEYTRGEFKHCPGDKLDCKEEFIELGVNVIKSAMLSRKVSRLSVKCPNQSCECYVELMEMENHLRLCTKQPMECPYVAIGCVNEISNKDEILMHLNSDSMNHSELLIELIMNLKNEVCVLRDIFEKSNLEIGCLKTQLFQKEERFVNLERENEINERRQTDLINIVNDLKKDMQENKWELLALKEELLMKENMTGNFGEELREMRYEMERKVIGERDWIEKELKIQRELYEDAIMKGEKDATLLLDWRNEICLMKEDMDTTRGLVDKIIYDMGGRKMTILEGKMKRYNKLYPNIDADFVWRIDQVSKNIQKRKWSDSFYSNNYKLCLSMYNYSDIDYIGLYCHIMEGDNDDRVEWPLRRAVTLSIIDQDTKKTHKSETYRRGFDRPTSGRGGGYVGSRFIQYSFIKNKSSIIVNDSIIVSCVISDQ